MQGHSIASGVKLVGAHLCVLLRANHTTQDTDCERLEFVGRFCVCPAMASRAKDGEIIRSRHPNSSSQRIKMMSVEKRSISFRQCTRLTDDQAAIASSI